MTRDLIHTVLPTVSQTSPEPDPSAHPLRLWCAWNFRCWRRTPSPLGCPGAYTSVKSVLVWNKGQTLSSLFWHGFKKTSFNSNTVLPLQACWNPACDPSGTPCFACVQSAGYHPWWTPHVLAWVQPGSQAGIMQIRGWVETSGHFNAQYRFELLVDLQKSNTLNKSGSRKRLWKFSAIFWHIFDQITLLRNKITPGWDPYMAHNALGDRMYSLL